MIIFSIDLFFKENENTPTLKNNVTFYEMVFLKSIYIQINVGFYDVIFTLVRWSMEISKPWSRLNKVSTNKWSINSTTFTWVLLYANINNKSYTESCVTTNYISDTMNKYQMLWINENFISMY